MSNFLLFYISEINWIPYCLLCYRSFSLFLWQFIRCFISCWLLRNFVPHFHTFRYTWRSFLLFLHSFLGISVSFSVSFSMSLLIFKYRRWQLSLILWLLRKLNNRNILFRNTLSLDQLSMIVLKIVIVGLLLPVEAWVIIDYPGVWSAMWLAIWILAWFFIIFFREFVTSRFWMWLLERLLVLFSWVIFIFISLNNLRRILRHSSWLRSSFCWTSLSRALGGWDRNLVSILL